MLSFKPAFSLSSLTFNKRLFSCSSFSAIRVVSSIICVSVYMRLLMLLPAILILCYSLGKCPGQEPHSLSSDAVVPTGRFLFLQTWPQAGTCPKVTVMPPQSSWAGGWGVGNLLATGKNGLQVSGQVALEPCTRKKGRVLAPPTGHLMAEQDAQNSMWRGT